MGTATKSGKKVPSKDLEDQTWYHGFRPRIEAERLMKDPGDYLVRATGAGNEANTELVLSVTNDGGQKHHLHLKFIDKQWCIFGGKKRSSKHRFDSIVDLVEFYKTTPIHRKAEGAKKMQLRNPVTRPKSDIKHESISYDPKKDRLGAGNFCSVFKGRLTKENGQVVPVALKISLTADCGGGGKPTEAAIEAAKKSREEMMQEAKIVAAYVHPNIITVHGAACDRVPLMVVLEFCAGGDLLSHLEKRGTKISIGEKNLYSLQAARGMKFLHRQRCVHRDLAARNCLISDKGLIKIADFGLSKMIEDIKQDMAADLNAQLPIRWMAPETISKSPLYSPASDVWAFGVLLYEVFTNGDKPYAAEDAKKTANLIRKGKMPEFPASGSDDLKKFVTGSIWLLDTSKRADMGYVYSYLRGRLQSCPPPKTELLVLNEIPGVTAEVFKMDESQEAEEPSGQTSASEDDKSNERGGKKGQDMFE